MRTSKASTFEKVGRQAWLSWIFVIALVALSTVLGVLQYRWIGEVSLAERERLRSSLQAGLRRVSQDFNTEMNSELSVLAPRSSESGVKAREQAYANHYAQWRDSSRHNRLFRRVAVAVPEDHSIVLRTLNFSNLTFLSTPWPEDWNLLRDRLTAKLPPYPQPGGPVTDDQPALIELPDFDFAEASGSPVWREIDWLILELDLDYVRSAMLPELLQRYVGAGQAIGYEAEIVMLAAPSTVIYRTEHAAAIGARADASVKLFSVEFSQMGRVRRRPGPFGPQGRGSARQYRRQRPDMPPLIDNADIGRWLLSVRNRAGSLEAAVARTRTRNLAVSAAILLLMMVAMAALITFIRRAQKLAELQMEFVAGVSHELRTPLSVICTAGHNLQGGVASNPSRVQRYGALIQEEGEKLTAIVEQVLRFASAKTGHIIGKQEPLSVEALIEGAVEASKGVLDESRCVVEKKISPELPSILGDAVALKHALQNLLSNAAKYGRRGDWIGISGSMDHDRAASTVEIGVADHGPGIPTGEIQQIFNPFYRGKKALEDQIHGTGLGLSLTKRIIEAHRGTITVESEQGKGTEFIVRIPAGRPAHIDAFTNSVN